MFIRLIIVAYWFAVSSQALSLHGNALAHQVSGAGISDGLDREPSKGGSSRDNLFAKTGLIVVPTPKVPSDYFLDSLAAVMSHGLSNGVRKKLTRLQYVIADDSISKDGVEAYYSHDMNAMIIGRAGEEGGSNPKRHLAHTWSLIAHEIGHAYVMSNLSADRLAFLARRFGPWRFESLSFSEQLLSRQFFSPHPLFGAPAGAIHGLENSPSRYALQNVHEWFAECFSAMIREKLRQQGIFPDMGSPVEAHARPLSAALQGWFRENVTY